MESSTIPIGGGAGIGSTSNSSDNKARTANDIVNAHLHVAPYAGKNSEHQTGNALVTNSNPSFGSGEVYEVRSKQLSQPILITTASSPSSIPPPPSWADPDKLSRQDIGRNLETKLGNLSAHEHDLPALKSLLTDLQAIAKNIPRHDTVYRHAFVDITLRGRLLNWWKTSSIKDASVHAQVFDILADPHVYPKGDEKIPLQVFKRLPELSSVNKATADHAWKFIKTARENLSGIAKSDFPTHLLDPSVFPHVLKAMPNDQNRVLGFVATAVAQVDKVLVWDRLQLLWNQIGSETFPAEKPEILDQFSYLIEEVLDRVQINCSGIVFGGALQALAEASSGSSFGDVPQQQAKELFKPLLELAENQPHLVGTPAFKKLHDFAHNAARRIQIQYEITAKISTKSDRQNKSGFLQKVKSMAGVGKPSATTRRFQLDSGENGKFVMDIKMKQT